MQARMERKVKSACRLQSWYSFSCYSFSCCYCCYASTPCSCCGGQRNPRWRNHNLYNRSGNRIRVKEVLREAKPNPTQAIKREAKQNSTQPITNKWFFAVDFFDPRENNTSAQHGSNPLITNTAPPRISYSEAPKNQQITKGEYVRMPRSLEAWCLDALLS